MGASRFFYHDVKACIRVWLEHQPKGECVRSSDGVQDLTCKHSRYSTAWRALGALSLREKLNSGLLIHGRPRIAGFSSLRLNGTEYGGTEYGRSELWEESRTWERGFAPA